MDVKKTNFLYRIQPTANGFSATADQPGLPEFEGTTREEVQKKIEDALASIISAQLPATLKLGPINVKLNSKVNIVHKPANQVCQGMQPNSLASGECSPTPAPITPTSTMGNFVALLLGAILIAVLVYFFILHR
jgi:hypothetical protein